MQKSQKHFIPLHQIKKDTWSGLKAYKAAKITQKENPLAQRAQQVLKLTIQEQILIEMACTKAIKLTTFPPTDKEITTISPTG